MPLPSAARAPPVRPAPPAKSWLHLHLCTDDRGGAGRRARQRAQRHGRPRWPSSMPLVTLSVFFRPPQPHVRITSQARTSPLRSETNGSVAVGGAGDKGLGAPWSTPLWRVGASPPRDPAPWHPRACHTPPARTGREGTHGHAPGAAVSHSHDAPRAWAPSRRAAALMAGCSAGLAPGAWLQMGAESAHAPAAVNLGPWLQHAHGTRSTSRWPARAPRERPTGAHA